MIKISIVVPMYNVENYLLQCVESIINQTYKNLEIILVNDGSTDKTIDIALAYEQLDSRIKVLNKLNGGITSARKAGKKIATGDYIVDVDADDWIECNRIEKIVQIIDKYNPDIVYSSGIYRESMGSNVLSELYFKEDKFYTSSSDDFWRDFCDDRKTFGRMLLRNTYCWTVKRDIAKYCQNEVWDIIQNGEDALITLFCAIKAKTIVAFPNPTYHYRQVAESVSHKEMQELEIVNLYNNLDFYLRNNKDIKINKSIIDCLKYWICINCAISIQTDKLYPFSNVFTNKRIVVYGAGGFGHRFVKEINRNRACNVVAWIDKVQRLYSDVEIKVEDIQSLNNKEYDAIVITIINEDVALQVKEELVQQGVPECKIHLMDREYMKTDSYTRLIE